MKSAVLAIRIIGDATGAVKAMNDAEKSAGRFRKGLSTASKVSTVALGAISGAAIACGNDASDLEQSVGGVSTVFGDQAKKMLDWSNNASQAVGLSKNEYNEFATVIGAQLQNMGMQADQSADQTNRLISLGADMASMFGGTTADAVDALSSALKGEMDPIERYGISLNDTTLQATAASMGLEDLYKSGDRNAKMQATLQAITQQSGKAVGNFAKEADTAQGQQQRMTAALTDAKAELGQAMLPILSQVAEKLASMAQWVQQNSAWLVPLATAIGAVAAVIVTINAAMSAYAAVAGVVAAAQTALNLAMAPTLGVILAIIAVIALLVAGIVLAIQHWDQIKEAGATAGAWIQQKWEAVTGFFGTAWTNISTWAGTAWTNITATCGTVVSSIQGKWQAFTSWIGSIWGNISTFAGTIWTGIGSTVRRVADNVRGAWNTAASWIRNAWNGLMGFFSSIPGRIGAFFGGLYDTITAPFRNAVNAIKSLWNSTVGGFGFDIPSWVPAVGGKSFRIPYLANGGVVQRAGFAVVGEAGPELLSLPRGAMVSPLTGRGAGGAPSPGPVTVNINVDAHGNLDNDAVAGSIVKALNQWAANRGRQAIA